MGRYLERLDDNRSAFLACVWKLERSEMVGKYKVITLCGSTRFKDAFMAAQKRLTLEGNIVISVGLFGHSGDNEVWEGMSEDTLTRTKEMLDDMHKRKIYSGGMRRSFLRCDEIDVYVAAEAADRAVDILTETGFLQEMPETRIGDEEV